MMATPERTCIGCGAKGARGDLVRLRLAEGGVEVDREGRGGRGAWLHPGAGCIGKAIRRRAFARAFRSDGAAVDEGLLLTQLTGNTRKD
jgi:predicted RNA-binding protein YlxR (DUF448 family)